MNRSPHVTIAVFCAGFVVIAAASCYRAPFVDGWYRCEADDQCELGFVCDDGVCCNAEGTPQCPTRARGNGLCPDGGAPATLYADRDLDGFGDSNTSGQFCGPPALLRYVPQNGDCVDTKGVGALVYPDAGELCDALDNDCDGVEDDGLSGSLYYQDSDNDGAGNAAVTRTFCAPPDGGWVVTSNDCDPNNGQIHPGAAESCDNIDSNCNGAPDDNPTDLLSCNGGQGVCAPGREVCQSGAKVCQSLATPSFDRCNGVDDNCNGATDEQPFCGGHGNLLITAVGKVAQRHSTFTSNPSYTACQKGGTGWSGTGASWAGATWSGDAARTHLLSVEHPNIGTATGFWDLTKPGVQLHFKWNVGMVRQNTDPAQAPWSKFGQPIIMLCSKNSATDTRIRWANSSSAMMTANSVNDEFVPLDGSGTRWLKATTGNLAEVERIEFIVQPMDNSAADCDPIAAGVQPCIPHFDLQFLEFGFVSP